MFDGKSRGAQTIECSCQTQLNIICRQAASSKKGIETHIFHGSIEAKVWISIHHICCLERTMLRSPCDEHDRQCYDSWTDLVGRAIYEDRIVIDSLRS